MRRFHAVASAVFACVAGCGDDGDVRRLPDAPVVDDAAIVDALPMGNVTVTTNVRCCDVAPTTPQADVLVVVVQPDGSPGESGTTDALGTLTLANVRPGASIAAIYPEDGDQSRHVTMMVGVKPGDALTFGDDYYQPDANGADGEIVVSWTEVVNADHYYVYSPCETRYIGGGATTSVVLYQYASCQTPTAPIALVAYDGSDNVLASAYLPAAAYTPGTLVAPAWTTQAVTPNFLVSISGLAASVAEVRLAARASFGSVDAYDSYSYLQPEAGAAMSGFSVPTTAPSTLASAQLYRSGTQGRQFVYQRGPSPLALTAPGLPWISGVVVSPDDARAIWLQSAGTYDAAVLSFNWSRMEGKVYRDYDWTVILPPGVTGFDLGTPPAALAPYLPRAEDNLGTGLELVDLASAADYDQVRALPEWRLSRVEASVQRGDEPTAAVSSYDGGEGFTFSP